jgi:HK97 family phage major capsid protein
MNGDNYKALLEKMGALYAEMQELVAGMEDATEEAAAEMQKKYEEKSKEYDALAKRRDMVADLNARAAKGAHSVVVVEERKAPAIATVQQRGGMVTDGKYADAFADYLKRGFTPNFDTRALSAGTGADGGFLPSEGFYAQLQKSIQQETSILNLCRRIPVGTFTTNLTLEVDFTSTDFDSGATEGWAGEGGAVGEYSPTYANVTFTGNALRRVVKVSKELVADAPSRGGDFSIESIVANRLGQLFAHSIEHALWQGNGTNKPQGITSASLTAGDTLGSAGTLTADELIDFVYALPQKYRVSPTCAIVAHDSFFKAVRKLKHAVTTSGTIPYLWEESFQAGEPARLLGIPVYASPYATTFGTTASATLAVIGDFQHFVMAERSGMEVQVLRELYAGNGQIGYMGEMRLDAKIARTDAFRTLVNPA